MFNDDNVVLKRVSARKIKDAVYKAEVRGLIPTNRGQSKMSALHWADDLIGSEAKGILVDGQVAGVFRLVTGVRYVMGHPYWSLEVHVLDKRHTEKILLTMHNALCNLKIDGEIPYGVEAANMGQHRELEALWPNNSRLEDHSRGASIHFLYKKDVNMPSNDRIRAFVGKMVSQRNMHRNPSTGQLVR